LAEFEIAQFEGRESAAEHLAVILIEINEVSFAFCRKDFNRTIDKKIATKVDFREP
jgi:hypothetical protein